MNSQRSREERIHERLQRGALPLAAPTAIIEATTNDAICYGCLEANADARIGDEAWHRLCALYWQGRSEAARGERIPHTAAGPGITPARSRWVIVVPVGRADQYAALRRRFGRSPWVDVVVDRRREERPQAVDRRTAHHDKTNQSSAPAFRLAYDLDGCNAYEATSPEAGRCPDCGVLVSLELPRFAEPPVRLELMLRHERTAHGVRHVGEVHSLSASGRILLSTRLLGRVNREDARGDADEGPHRLPPASP
jgi:hypothetical protein